MEARIILITEHGSEYGLEYSQLSPFSY